MSLAGRRLLITRTAAASEVWAGALRARGVEPVVLPCIDAAPLPADLVTTALSEALHGAAWLVLTSPRAVAALPELASGLRVAVVGPATARAVAERWAEPDLVAPDGTAASLVSALAPRLDPADVVVAALSTRAPSTLRDGLAGACRFVRVDVYRTVPAPAAEVPTPLASRGLDAALLASPSAVVGLANRAVVPPSLPLVSIGPTTSAAIVSAGWVVAAEADRRDLEGLLEATASALSPLPESP